jgi:serine/threonine-protein kinase
LALTPGTRLGVYEVTSQIGEGGMGQVYRARDTKLNRDVALKILPDAFASDPERLARFTREAQTLASLNHPNIAHIYGLEESNNVRALVMELVGGEDLSQRIARGAIPLAEALPIAKQIAEALEAAHEQGIIHRDLKPANVKVCEDGTVKVLDFGLAKALEPAGPASPSVSMSPTITTPAMTQAGIILGTAAYMSPEQAKGRSADKRSDVWAFGCVLYEMLTGQRAFEGEDVSDTLATVLKSDPDWTRLPADTPLSIQRLLRRCLEKHRKTRIPDIAIARFEMEEVLSESPAGPIDRAATATTSTPPSPVRRWLAIVGAALTAGLAVGVSDRVLYKPVSQAVVRLDAMPSDGSAVGDQFPAPDVVITPDGSHIVYDVGNGQSTAQLFVRRLDQLEAMPLKGLTGVSDPFISPDGQWVGYFDGATMKKVAISGGPSVAICALSGVFPRGASWGPGDIIVFGTAGGGGLQRVGAGGGQAEVLAKPDPAKGEQAYVLPEILPGGRAVLFSILPATTNPDNGRIAVLDLKTGQTKVLVQGGSNPRYAPSGHLVYAAAGSLRAVPFDVDRLELRGNPVAVVEHVATKGPLAAANFAVAKNGTLVYRTGDAQGGANRTLVWVDRLGHEEPLGVPLRAYAYPHLSPDGTKLALDVRDQESGIWVWDLVRHGPLTRLTLDTGVHRGGIWSLPDGRRIAFSAERDGAENIYWQAADGTGTAERLTDRPKPSVPQAFTPDGTRLLFVEPTVAPSTWESST